VTTHFEKNTFGHDYSANKISKTVLSILSPMVLCIECFLKSDNTL
jgi:hypothetical protein